MNNIKSIASKIVEIAIIISIIFIVIIILRDIIIKINYPQKYSEYIEKYAKEYQIDKELIYAMVKVESSFKNEAISNKDAIGLMQILESTAYEIAEELEIKITKEEIFNPETNIRIGTKYMSNLIERYNNIELAIVAYNAGIGNVDSWIKKGTIQKDGTRLENIPYKETNNYVRKVMRDYKIYMAVCN